jgi:hypothetical protein
MHLNPFERIRDTGIVSRVRGYLAHHADLEQVQMILAKHWYAEINFRQVLKMDAVCYEIGLPKQLYPLSYGCKTALGMLRLDLSKSDRRRGSFSPYAKL